MICKTADNLNLYYKITGNENASQTLVFLNGLTQSTDSWILMLPHFKDKYKILLMDFIFQGQSDKLGEWRDFDTHAKDLKAILDQENMQEISIVGISYGSMVAQHFAVNYPSYLKKLVLVSTFAHKTPYYEAIELSWWRALEMGGYSLMLDIMLPSILSENYFSNPMVSIANLKKGRKDLQLSSEAIFNLMRATKERKDFRKNLQKITAPTLIIQGEKDMLVPVHLAEEVNKSIQGSKLIVVANAGHTLNLEHVEEVCRDITDFLD
ncbi:alpha/beta hydrolase [Sphingobacteriaceae bacterium]|nr:alpha/beta hydrolase [Sphingobacteriaceae bacterium]